MIETRHAPNERLLDGLQIAGSVVRRAKWIIIAFLLIVVAGGAVAAVASYKGYCFSERRYLDDQEFRDAAISALLGERAGIQEARDGNRSYQNLKILRVPSVGEFKSMFPDCCAFVSPFVGDWSLGITRWDKLRGRAARVVEITFRYHPGWVDISKPTELNKVRSAVGNCGDVLKR